MLWVVYVVCCIVSCQWDFWFPLSLLLCRLTAKRLRTLTSCSHVSLWKWRPSTVWSSWTLKMMHSETFPSSIPILPSILELCAVCTLFTLVFRFGLTPLPFIFLCLQCDFDWLFSNTHCHAFFIGDRKRICPLYLI